MNFKANNTAIQAVVAAMLLTLVISAQSAFAAQNVTSHTPDFSDAERSYFAHSMHRNQIADRLNAAWHAEKLLKAQYEATGRSDDRISFNGAARNLLEVRQEIDTLRAELSQENQLIAQIGESIPD